VETLVFADEQAVRGRLVLALIGAGPPGQMLSLTTQDETLG